MRRRRMRHRRRVILITVAAVVAVLLGIGGVAYAHLNSNIRVMALQGGGTVPTDHVGHHAINVLVIGSDTRASKQDCKIGGDCNPATSTSTDATSASANADVEMLVHLAANRRSATVLSIPRDTIVTVPRCTDPRSGAVEQPHPDRINSTLAYGPSCTVDAVHQLTGVPINHFVVIDFAGTIRMSDAIGGVRVCVTANVYDPFSHLKLTKGSHTLKGLAALEFLRTRHGFGDGSDLGREGAQHLFLASMLRKMKSASTLANPVTVYNLADAATKAITVDPGLGSVADLVNLAYQYEQVPSGHTTFLTMPTVLNPANPATVLPGPGAKAIFHALATDRPLPTPKPRAPRRSGSGHSAPARTTSPATPSPTSTASTGTTGSTSGCAPVSRQNTVVLNGIPMTPTQAFARSPKVPVSAP